MKAREVKHMHERPTQLDGSRQTPQCVATEYSDPQATRCDDPPLADFPAIARLRLTPPEFDALKIQGHVGRERRGNREVFKLRSRIDGKQFVRYIASDPERGLEVARELAALQHDRQVDLALLRATKLAAQMLRESKKKLEPLLAEEGLHFYGYELRRRRTGRLDE
jgi:hypothetical protein